MFEKIQKLMVYTWDTSKLMFEDLNDFKRMYQIANEAVKNTPSEKEQKFVKAVLLAILDYIEADWRERNERNR